MTDRPIIFSAPMVRALLDGRKTQTRRIIKPVRGYEYNNVCRPDLAAKAHEVWWHGEYERVGVMQACPFGQPGDQLWVREAHAFVWPGEDQVSQSECDIQFRADLPPGDTDGPGQWPHDEPDCPHWRPSIHMPRWASRLTLVVTDIRAQRLQDVSEDDALAEGVTKVRDCCHVIRGFDYDLSGLCHTHAVTPFAKLWDHIHGPGAWDANPWVWALSFTVHHGNIDALPAQQVAA